MATGDRRDPASGGFKRAFVLPGVVLTACELAFVVLPLDAVFGLAPEQRTLLVRAGVPIAVGGVLIWLAAMASWLLPVQRAMTVVRAGRELDEELAARAYRALSRVPLRALWLRTGLWIAAGLAVGGLLHATSTAGPRQILTFGSVVAVPAFAVNIVRAAWYSRVFARLRRTLFPALDPLRQFSDRHFRRILLVALASGGAALGALAAFVYFFLPLASAQYLDVVTYLPGSVALATGLWYAYARRARRPIDRYLEPQLDPRARKPITGSDPLAVAAYRAAQTLPYRLAGVRLLTSIVGVGLVAVVLLAFHGVRADDAVLMFGAAVVIVVGASIYEAIWHRDTMRPLLSHLSVRHRLPVREIRMALSLRAKLLLSFGGLVLFACGLSLLWGFVQYKKLATTFVATQAQLKLDWVRSEVQNAAMQAGDRPSATTVWKVLAEAAVGSGADGAVYVYVPSATGQPSRSVGGGDEGAPRLPWYATAKMRAGGRGALEVASLELAGHYQRLAVVSGDRTIDLGAVAVLYPGYRGRGPGIGRPLQELLVFFLVLFSLCGGIVVLTVREFTTPIRELEQRADEMARGELSRPVTSIGEGDEVGRLTFAIEEMRRALRDKLRSTEEVNLDLEREVQRRTADLARKNRELAEALEKLRRAQSQLVRSEKMASIGQLVAGIAHEINNPVNAIVNTVSPLAEAVDEIAGARDPGEVTRLSDDVREMVGVIQRGARRTKDIVQALHNYSRTDDERLVEFDLNRGLDDSLELLRHHLKGTIVVERRYGEVGRLRAHAGQVNQVFMNLLTNAAQALAGREGARISVVTRRRGELVEIQIADNGPGISEEILPRIFDPFFTTKEVGQGSGLGLSIVHGIVERHGGTIEVDSQVGKGTTFTVTLPVSQRALGESVA